MATENLSPPSSRRRAYVKKPVRGLKGFSGRRHGFGPSYRCKKQRRWFMNPASWPQICVAPPLFDRLNTSSIVSNLSARSEVKGKGTLVSRC